jgi:hypothetical protein
MEEVQAGNESRKRAECHPVSRRRTPEVRALYKERE